MAGISSLVAGAVRNLKPSQVVLVDETGELLNGAGGEDDTMAAATTLLEARQQHEQRYKRTIVEHLIPIVGSASDVSVAVTVDVGAAATETNKMTYDPNSQVTMSENIKESSSKKILPLVFLVQRAICHPKHHLQMSLRMKSFNLLPTMIILKLQNELF